MKNKGCKKKKINCKLNECNRKKFLIRSLIFICILSIGLVRKTFQNDTFYTIKIGELIMENGIDMMDHFSYHSRLAYTYPHWLYDTYIYLVYNVFGYTGVYISSIVLLMVLLLLVFKTNQRIANNNSVAVFATFICALAVSGFATARAQLVSFIVFVLQIYFIETFLKNGKKKYLGGLLLLSLILCNVHVAVWPFYFILYLPYLAEYFISWLASKFKIKNKYKLTNFLKNKFVLEKNEKIKFIALIMVVSLLTGVMTPIGDTPYTYLIKTMLGNSQDYIVEHQMLSWVNSPFTIIIAFETVFLMLISKVKLRDLFMICGLVLMSIVSTRHLSLLALIGTICFARLFAMFLEYFGFDIDDKIITFCNKWYMRFGTLILVVVLSSLLFIYNNKKEYIDSTLYPVEAVKYIKENINIEEMRIFNEYNFGSYLILHDIPVFIDSRADLYTKQFSGFEYDIFDDYYYMASKYQESFEFYDITHVLIYKDNTSLYNSLNYNNNYKVLYEDEYFILYEKLGESNSIVIFN